MKPSILLLLLLLVLYSLQVSALKEKRTPNSSPVQNNQAIFPQIVDLNKKLTQIQQREDDNKRKLGTIENETRLRMQEKEKEVNKTLASCRREASETNKPLQALENLINTTEHRIIETVKLHSGLNYKHIDNAISSNKRKSWSDARKYCQELGLDLIAIETETEDQVVMQYLNSIEGRVSDFVSTSGCYSNASDSFVWRSTGEQIS
ncbi:hypothetical protein B566_EDAN010076, partial [Ephemera danica]